MEKKKYLIIGGTFDNNGGKPSSIINKISNVLQTDSINGGYLSDLKSLDLDNVTVLIWMPNIDNSEDKILPNIKKTHPKLFLISSKRVIEKEYSDFDIVSRLLKSHSNLGIAINKEENTNIYRFRLIDPLGNIFSNTTDINKFCNDLKNRVENLLVATRVNSKKVENMLIDNDSSFEIDDRFIDIVKRYGNAFTEYVNAVNPNRFLGNASTRCMRGFPGYRLNDNIYLISKRNVDKETINKDDFVPVLNNEDFVYYMRDNKPSVDSPIQIRLFNYYMNVNYMIHGHVYLKDAKFTKEKTPCGYIEEFDNITELYSDKHSSNFCINLKGHGCLILAKDLDYLESKLNNLISRPFLEED